MQKNLITTFLRLAVRSTVKPSNAAARNSGVSIVRALNTAAIFEPETSSKFSQQQSPGYASKTMSASAIRAALDIGTETSSQALRTLNSLGYKVSLEECKAAILHNIESAQRSNDEEFATGQMAKAFELLVGVKEEGYFVEEDIYGPLLKYVIDKKMVEEFDIVLQMIRDGQGIPDSSPEFARFSYYEMLLWIKLKDKEKVNEVCSLITKSFKELSSGQEKTRFKPSIIRRRWRKTRGSADFSHNRCLSTENYLLELCERGQHEDVLRILETLDITRVKSFDILTSIFEHLGRSLSEYVAKKLLRELNENGLFYFRKNDVSELIFSYVSNIPNLWVGGALFKFNEMLEELKVSPSSASYQNFIKYSCDSREEELGLSILEHMYEVDLEISSDTATYLFSTVEQNYGFDLLRGVEEVLKEMNKEKDESRMFHLRLAVYIWEVLFGRCEPKHKQGDGYKPWLKNFYFRIKLDDYEKCPTYQTCYDMDYDDESDTYFEYDQSDDDCSTVR